MVLSEPVDVEGKEVVVAAEDTRTLVFEEKEQEELAKE